jgi:transposase InsO family protein
MFREFVKGGLAVLRDLARDRAKLVAENALLRQQVIVLKRSAPRPHLKSRDRFTIATITKIFPVLLDAVAIVRPETVVRWHRAFWRLLWHRRSQRPVGRPPIDADTRALIIRMWKENPLRGEDVIAAELAKLGYHVSARTVAKYRPANLPRGQGQKWLTFVRNHLGQTWACDWFTIVSLKFHLLYAFVILDLKRREIVHIGVTSHPSAQYAAQSFVEAVSDRDDQAPRFLIRDRDSIYGVEFGRRVKSCGTRCLLTPRRVPQANAFCERVIGTLRRECLDNLLVLDDLHAERILRAYRRYYHGRPHRGLRMRAPAGARWLPPARPVPAKAVRSRAILGGLHHEYQIAA